MREFKPLLATDDVLDAGAVDFPGEPQLDVQESARRIRVLYRFPGFGLSSVAREATRESAPYRRVSIDGIGMLSESGKPELPSFGRYVQIPFNCDFEVSVYPGTPVEFDDVLVAPAQANASDAPGEEGEFEYDADAYQSEEVYPSSMVHVSGPFEMDGYNTVLIHVCPFEYLASKKRLTGYGDVEVVLDLTARDREGSYPEAVSDDSGEAYGNLLINPRRNVAERLRMEPGVRPIPSLPQASGPTFLIIHAQEFKAAAQRLASWKNARGLQTETVSIDQASSRARP